MKTQGLLAVTALVCSLAALGVATWAAVTAARTREDIQQLGELLGRMGRPPAMQLEVIRPPEFDLDDR